MQAEFWHQKWANNEIGFHQPEINGFLQQYWPKMSLPAGAEVLVPLCGKSMDMLWLVQQGCKVLGVELSDKALKDFISENALHQMQPFQKGPFSGYRSESLSLYCGDFFQLDAEVCQKVAALYDRAALVALPQAMRQQYAEHLQEILPSGTQILLVAMDYDQHVMPGPPFAVSGAEVEQLFGKFCDIETLQSHRFERKGVEVTESVYRLIKQ